MIIHHKQEEGKGYFYVQIDGEVKAQMVYRQPSDDIIVIEHTEVNDEIRGKNVGYQMVNASVTFARNHFLKIVPECPFVCSVFKKKKDYADVLASE